MRARMASSSPPCGRIVRLGGLVLCVAAALAVVVPPALRAQGAAVPTLAATVHPPLPADLRHYWLVPGGGELPATDSQERLADGVRLVSAGRFDEALGRLDGEGLEGSPLLPYVRYYRGVALLGLTRYEDAADVFGALAADRRPGAIGELAAMRFTDAALAGGFPERAKPVTEAASRGTVRAIDQVLLQLARAEEGAGHLAHAIEVYRRLHYEFPLGVAAAAAAEALDWLGAAPLTPEDYVRALARAERLFDARRWTDARAAFADLASLARPGDRDRIAFRLAQADHHLNRHQAARDALRPLLDHPAYGPEARFVSLTSTRALGQHAAYVTLVRGLVSDHPDSEWAAEALSGLATHYLSAGNEAQADGVFRELYRRFPTHRLSERAAWRIGWRAYRQGRFAETATLFEQAAAVFPRSDHRPQWLYWSGRARDRMGDRAAAAARYRLTVLDYQNLYHGRLAAQLLAARQEPPVPANVATAATPAMRPVNTEPLIRALAAAGLYDDALVEVTWAQQVWGDSPQLQATAAWLLHQQGLQLTATLRFTALRGAITTMRRAYPQFMAAGGEALPAEVLRIIFPLDYWPLIEKYSAAHGLDPWLMAALMAQESTFTPEIRSSANAIGLMQIIPATGERYAARLGIRPFSSTMLTQPDTNVRIGMRYFKDLVDRFGGAHYALAGYNAGEGRVDRWRRERPGMAQDEFIEDIPFAETQNYVKRILGTAEDYRRLYGSGLLDPHGGARTASIR
jgi:soluble lytic murein transglycosylase